MKIFIDSEGNISGIESPLTRSLELPERRRISRVEPTNPVLRVAFNFIRARTRDDSWLAGFTRQWPCRWRARIFDGPVLGPFTTRQAAIDAEIAWYDNFLEESHGKS